MESNPNNHGPASAESSKSSTDNETGSSPKKKKATRAPLGLGKSFTGGEGDSSSSKSSSEQSTESKDTKKEKSAETGSAAVSAWRNSFEKPEAGPADATSKEVEKPKHGSEATQPQRVAEVIDLDAYRQKKAEREASDKDNDEPVAQAEKPKFEAASETNDNIMEYPMAVGAEPPMGPPPVGWGESRKPSSRPEHLRSIDMNAESGTGESAGGEGGEAGTGPEAAAVPGTGAGESRSRSSDEADESAPEAEPDDGEEPEAVEPEDPTPPNNTERTAWFMDNRGEGQNDNARTPGDVRRAAAGGALVGWLVGRHGKKKAVRRAIDATKRRLQPVKKWSFWKPDYDKYNPERFKKQPETIRTVEKPAVTRWLNPEVKSPAANRLTAERLASTPLVETLAVPAAVAATRLRSERQPRLAGAEKTMNETQMVELARTIKIEDVSLSKIYESKQIDQEGLRSVIAAYLRGENVQKALSRAVTEKQKSFERDPYSRKQNQESPLRKAAGQVGGALAATGAGLAQGSQFVASKVGQGVSTAATSVSSAASNIKAPAGVTNRASANEGNNSSSVLGIFAVVIIYALILVLWLTR